MTTELARDLHPDLLAEWFLACTEIGVVMFPFAQPWLSINELSAHKTTKADKLKVTYCWFDQHQNHAS